MTKSFKKYMEEVDVCLQQAVGATSEDLPDYDYYSAYEDEQPVDEVVQEVLEGALR